MRTFGRLTATYSRYQITGLLMGVGHGLSDGAAGYLIGDLSQNAEFVQTGSAILLYNALAFGGQLPAGIWLDRIGHYRQFAALSLLGMTIALGILSCQLIWVAVGLAGISSAIFHVAGGAATLVCFPGKSRFVGLFSAFGVIGLALGGWAGAMQYVAVGYCLMIGMPGLVLLLLRTPFPLAHRDKRVAIELSLDQHDYLMILLLVAIALRSAIWNSLQLLYNHQYDWLIYMALAAMVGKLVGGWLIDHIPWKIYTLTALTIAIPALSWGHRKLFWLMVGAGLLQSLTPLSVIALQRVLPDRPASVSGAVFGLAIAAGGLLTFMPSESSWLWTPLFWLGLLAGGGYYIFLKRTQFASSLEK